MNPESMIWMLIICREPYLKNTELELLSTPNCSVENHFYSHFHYFELFLGRWL